MSKISVIVPIYNCELYIKECIDSILNQSFSDFELILVDDESTDNSYKICKEYGDKRIKLYSINHGGVSSARNFGLKKSKSDYVCFVDSDDILLKDYLMELYNLIIKYNASISEIDIGIYKDKLKDSNKVSLYNFDDMIKRLYSKYGIRTVFPNNKLYRKSLFSNIKFENVVNEDEFIIHKLLYCGKRIVVSDRKLYLYRIRSDSRQRTFSKDRLNILNVFLEREKYITNKELLHLNYVARLDMIIYLSYFVVKNKEYKYISYLLNEFNNIYDKNKKYNFKRKIKYYLFRKHPIVLSKIMLKFKRYRYV